MFTNIGFCLQGSASKNFFSRSDMSIGIPGKVYFENKEKVWSIAAELQYWYKHDQTLLMLSASGQITEHCFVTKLFFFDTF